MKAPLKEFGDDKFMFYENGRKFSKLVENTVEKGEIACYEQFLLFPQCFQNTFGENQGLFGQGIFPQTIVFLFDSLTKDKTFPN